MLISCKGGIHGAYILRTLGSVEFNYENAKSHLIDLDLASLHQQTIHFNTAAGDEAEGGVEMKDERHTKLMQLATWINLDSRFSVRSKFRSIFDCFAHSKRWAVPEQSSATYNGEKLPNTCPMTLMRNSHFGSVPSRCSPSETRSSSMLIRWRLFKSLVPKTTQTS